jgi:hypothetical protein
MSPLLCLAFLDLFWIFGPFVNFWCRRISDKLYLKTRAGIIISWQTFEHDNNISGSIQVRSKLNVYVTANLWKKTFNVELEVNLLKLVCNYVEIKGQLDATYFFYCKKYCLINMFRALLCPLSGALELYRWLLPVVGLRNAAASCKPDA